MFFLLKSAIFSGDMLVNAIRILYGCVIAFGLLLAVITFHSFTPVLDPLAPVTMLDKISYWMGVHEKSVIVIVDVGKYILPPFLLHFFKPV